MNCQEKDISQALAQKDVLFFCWGKISFDSFVLSFH